jgi:hypothetical protein
MYTILNKLKNEQKESSKPATVRLPETTLAEIDAFCKLHSVNRSRLLKELITEGFSNLNATAQTEETPSKPKLQLNQEQSELRQSVINHYGFVGSNANRDAQRKLNVLFGLTTTANKYKFENLTEDQIEEVQQKLNGVTK